MTPQENLHFALGEIAFAIARADGKVQKEERKKFHDMIAAELRCKNYDFDTTDTIFQILDKEKSIDAKTSYDWAIKQIELNGHYLSPELKNTYVKVIEKIAKAYPPVTIDEKNIIEKFKEDIAPIVGDPVYYKDNRSV